MPSYESAVDRHILHVDVVAFAVAVERVVEPTLNGRPVVVAPPGGSRSLVAAASAEARREGIAVGMPLTWALRRCRSLVVLAPNPSLYGRASRALEDLFAGYSPLVERYRHGHIYLDLTGTKRLFGPVRDTAARLQREIRSHLRLEATLGLATNKLVSKVASELVAPPPGMENVSPGLEECFLAPLPVRVLPGVGAKTREELTDYNVRRVGELARIPVPQLVMAFGRAGVLLSRKARGIDPTPVFPRRTEPVLKEEESFAPDTNDFSFLVDALHRLVERGGRHLRESGKAAGKLTVRLCHSDLRETKAVAKLRQETDADPVLFATARPLLAKLLARRVRVRWLALFVEKLTTASAQIPLFPSGPTSKSASLLSALDDVRARYGERAVRRGVATGR